VILQAYRGCLFACPEYAGGAVDVFEAQFSRGTILSLREKRGEGRVCGAEVWAVDYPVYSAE